MRGHTYRVAVSALDWSEMGMFVERPGERHSPLGSEGKAFALCEEGSGGMGWPLSFQMLILNPVGYTVSCYL